MIGSGGVAPVQAAEQVEDEGGVGDGLADVTQLFGGGLHGRQ